jgi:N-acylglucosamine-6-phosphate 2-epimerase
MGLRLEGVQNIEYVRRHTEVPIIGLSKLEIPESERLDRVYITGTFADAEALAAAGADIIAIDATGRPRPDGGSLKDLINAIKTELNKPVWADVATYEEGATAAEYGADVVSTTMYGYTKETLRPAEAGPDFELLERFCRDLPALIVLEGRVWHPEEVTRAFQLGAHAVVVGSAITRPQLITRRFVHAIPNV